ncbi:hypothetical protein BH11PSE2_BH11PSE2_06730 [soil metagenome]
MTATLTAVETEQVRDLRARLNRIPKGVLGDKSVGPLSKGFFDVCARVGLPVSGQQGQAVAIAALIGQTAEADLEALAKLVSGLRALRDGEARRWRDVFDAGVLQAVLTRRLVLAGREQPVDTGVR